MSSDEDTKERTAAPTTPERNRWLLDQRGLVVLCPSQVEPPATELAARTALKSRSGEVRMVDRDQCTVDDRGGLRHQAFTEWCRICPNNSYTVRWSVIDPQKYSWLESMISQLNLAYQDWFELVPTTRLVIRHKLHRKCIECRYRFVFKPGTEKRLPNEHSAELMQLLEAGAPSGVLVETRRGQSRNFCDWGWDLEGEAWLAVYLKP